MLIFCDDCKNRPKMWGAFNRELNGFSAICSCGWRVISIQNLSLGPGKKTSVKGKFISQTVREDCDECRDYEFDGVRPTRFEQILADC